MCDFLTHFIISARFALQKFFIRIKVQEIRKVRDMRCARRAGVVGFVPTMGALHAGHISLVRRAREMCECVVVSIFVNRMQFNSKEDFVNYPTQLDRDLQILKEEGVDIAFLPEEGEMWVQTSEKAAKSAATGDGSEGCIFVQPGDLGKRYEGKYRPGHFAGMLTIVAKLFNIIQPDYAFFGQKDAQQLALVQNMVEGLNFDVVVVPCPTVRESSGLALSSRNARLSQEALAHATLLYRSLCAARASAARGPRAAKIAARRLFAQGAAAATAAAPTPAPIQLEYFDIVNPRTFAPLPARAPATYSTGGGLRPTHTPAHPSKPAPRPTPVPPAATCNTTAPEFSQSHILPNTAQSTTPTHATNSTQPALAIVAANVFGVRLLDNMEIWF